MTVLAVLVAALGALQAPAVEGVVRSADGQPIAYAQVRVVGDSVADWTDDRGRYRLPDLGRGSWALRVVHAGHDTLDVEVYVPGDRPLRLDMTLTPRAAPTEEPLSDFRPIQVEYTLPAVLNTERVARLIRERYPPELMARRIGGETVLRMWLDERGQVVRSILSSSSGSAVLDSIALELSDRMRFRPARSGNQGVRVIVRVPVFFTVPDSTAPDSTESDGGSRRR